MLPAFRQLMAGRDPSETMFRFGVFELDVRVHELRKNGRRVRLQGQPLQVLELLVQRAGEVVTREELRKQLWPADTFVDFDHSVNNAVARIRETLGDASDAPRFIDTVPRRGYRFLADALSAPETEPPADAAREERPATKWLLTAWAISAVAAAAAFVLWSGVYGQPKLRRIAVLPLKNLSAEPDSEYFSDGLTDEIIRQLSMIDGLEVTSHTSSFAFKGQPRNIREVRRQLGVDLVLEGSVRREGDRVRVTASLARTENDTTVWSARYDRDVGDALLIEDEISRSIVNQLRLKNVGGQRRYNADAAVYDLYMRAEALNSEMTPGNDARLRRAVDLYQEAIDRQPDFAPAYAGMASAYSDLRNRGQSRDSDEKMRRAARKALELDPLLGEAYATIGLEHAVNAAWPDAEHAFRRALELDPSSSVARIHFAQFVLLPEGKVQEALQQARKAVELDPLSGSCQIELTYVLLRARRYEEALATATKRLEADPHDEFASQLRARALMLAGKHQDAIAGFEKLGPGSHGYLGYAYATVGLRDEAARLAAEEDPAAARHQVLIFTALDDRKGVFQALQMLVEMHDPMADIYPGEPELASLHDDPHMKDFRRQRNLPD